MKLVYIINICIILLFGWLISSMIVAENFYDSVEGKIKRSSCFNMGGQSAVVVSFSYNPTIECVVTIP